MLDLKLIRESPEAVQRGLANRGAPSWCRRSSRADADRRRLLTEVETLKAERNRASEAIGQAKRRGENPEAVMARMREVSDRIKALDVEVKQVDARMEPLLLQLPNLPHPSVPEGSTEDENVETSRWGEPRRFDFEPKPHDVLGEALGILDFARAVKLSKSRFTVMWGAAARLERALAQFMLDLHSREHGYTEVWVPQLVSGATMLRTGQLPKFEEQLFKTQEPDENRTLYLIPTAEVPVTALHADEILGESTLPRRYVCFTPCYRREAGTYGKDMKGMIRQHQFDKVELVKVTTPAQSYDELDAMVRERRGGAPAPGTPVSRGAALRGRCRLRRRQELRPRGVAAGAGEVPRDLLVLELRGVPGAPARSEVSPGRRRPRRVLPYAERVRARRRPHADRRARELPGGRRIGHGARGRSGRT